MKEYAIEPYEVNAALVAGNHEPLTTWDNSGDAQPRFTGQIQAHNEEVKRLLPVPFDERVKARFADVVDETVVVLAIFAFLRCCLL